MEWVNSYGYQMDKTPQNIHKISIRMLVVSVPVVPPALSDSSHVVPSPLCDIDFGTVDACSAVEKLFTAASMSSQDDIRHIFKDPTLRTVTPSPGESSSSTRCAKPKLAPEQVPGWFDAIERRGDLNF